MKRGRGPSVRPVALKFPVTIECCNLKIAYSARWIIVRCKEVKKHPQLQHFFGRLGTGTNIVKVNKYFLNWEMYNVNKQIGTSPEALKMRSECPG